MSLLYIQHLNDGLILDRWIFCDSETILKIEEKILKIEFGSRTSGFRFVSPIK